MYGVDQLALKDYNMRSATAMWLGAAEARGITVKVPQGSFYYLLTNIPVVMEQGMYGYVHRPRIENLVKG